MRLVLTILMLTTYIWATNIERMTETFCDKDKLTQLSKTIDKEKFITEVWSQKICSKLSKKRLQKIADYFYKKSQKSKKIAVPKDAKCPVCGMFVAKYPVWVAYMDLKDGENLYFDGVKDMMKFYLDPKRFHHNPIKATSIKVTDYYTAKAIEAKSSYFVIGSNVYGPMGEELIPFKSREDAKEFMSEHKGKKIVTFDKITDEFLY